MAGLPWQKEGAGVSWCDGAGKLSYTSRKVARRKARIKYPDAHLSAYRCAYCTEWHIGNLPLDVIAGEYGRDSITDRGSDGR